MIFKKIPEDVLSSVWQPALVNALCFPPLNLEWSGGEGEVRLSVSAQDMKPAHFLVFYQKDTSPRQIASLAAQSLPVAQAKGLLPLLLVPYLSEERLRELEARQVSGLDLCGNGVVLAPGRFTFYRTGYPNRYTSSRPLKNAYRGSSSLVARAFLLQPVYSEVGEVQQTIRRLGGGVSLPTVSKALTELEADQIIERTRQVNLPQARALQLLQPDKLLRRLEENYTAPRIRPTFVGKVELEGQALQQALLVNARRSAAELVVTGIGSATRYASLAMEKTLSLYTTSLESLLAGFPRTATDRFPNLRVYETDDPTVWFDARPDETGFPWASPLQAYLEMAHSEPRLRQTAEQVRDALLASVKEKMP